MIVVKTVNTLTKQAYERYVQDPRSVGERSPRDREAFCDAVKAIVVTGLVFEAAQLVLGASTDQRETELAQRESAIERRESELDTTGSP